jgi:hypothetical protein
MSAKKGAPFLTALHPRGFAGLFTQKPTGLKIKRKRPDKGTAHLAVPAKRKKMMTKKIGPRTKPLGLPNG